MITYVPWIRTELKNLPKDFSDPLQDSDGFTKEFDLTVRTCDPGYSDLFQLIHLLASESKATELLNMVCWETPVEESFVVESQVTLRRTAEN